MAASADVNPGARETEEQGTTKPGPANPQGSSDLDAPTPPGGPLRSDAPTGSVAPGGPGTPTQPGQPQEVEPPTRRVEEPVGSAGQEASRTPQDQNAETSQGEPSDDSGSE
ncbi:MAG TPA: hypothetical protein VK964_03005 [Nocardioidaceae bacterium]|nr:hypothetical protein [Nocardioidaceae bacterium]